jgi:hypothetical protein
MNQKVTFTQLGKTLTLSAEPSVTKTLTKGEVEVKSLNLSAESIQAGQPLTLSAELEGEQIAHIFVVAYLVHDGIAYGPVYQAFCTAPLSKTVGGVVYPEWETKINFSHTFTLELPLLDNEGQQSFGFAKPLTYAAQPDEQLYEVSGWFTRQDRTERSKVRLRFTAEGKLLNMITTGKKVPGIAREFSPQAGDLFSPFAKSFHNSINLLSADEDRFMLADEIALSWDLQRVYQPALAGEYYVGIMIEDMEGNYYRQGKQVKVAP